MDRLRERIDEIDCKLVALISERFKVTRAIGAFKRRNGLEIFDPIREASVIESRRKLAADPRDVEYVGAMMRHLMQLSRSEQRRGMNVYLVGMPGAGKTRMAQAVSLRSGLPWIDADAEIEKRCLMTVAELFEREGEEAFRKLERAVMEDIAELGYHVVATGGGVLTYEGSAKLLRMSGRIVFLDRALDRLMEQDTSDRPLMKDGRADIERLYRARYEAYRQAADLTLDPDDPEALETLYDYCVE